MVRSLILLAVSLVFSVNADTCRVSQGPVIMGNCPLSNWIPVGEDCCLEADIVKCEDKMNPKTPGQSDCPRMVAYCTNSLYLVLMKDQCPKTCGFCTSSGGSPPAGYTCVDKMNPNTPGQSDCPRMVAYCRNSFYLDLMRDQCPKTCGFC